MTNSRISGFYDLTLDERRAKLTDSAGLTRDDLAVYATNGGLSPEAADHMIENVIGTHALPLGIALNFQVNGRDVLVPMAVEEPSVVAGASFMAKLARAGGGLAAHCPERNMIGQMQILVVANVNTARRGRLGNKARLLDLAIQVDPVTTR